VFHVPYLEVSRTIWKTRKAGAEILDDAEVDRIALLRGTMGVQRPSLGGQVGSERVMANAFRRRAMEEKLVYCRSYIQSPAAYKTESIRCG